MKSKMGWLIPLLSLGLALPNGANAEQKQAEKAGKKEAEKIEIPDTGWSNGSFLGPGWWNKNPKNFTAVPQLWLYHVDLSYAYSEQSGNTEAKSHRGDLDLYLRKDLLTSITSYHIGNKDTLLKLTDKETVIKDEEFRQGFRYALTHNMSAVVGYLWMKNSGKYIAERSVPYAGLRYVAVNTPQYGLILSGFYGYESKTSYMSYKIREKNQYKTFPDVPEYTSDTGYLSQQFEWNITDVITFSQRLDYMKFLEDSDFYAMKLNFKLDFKFSKNTSFFVSYRYDYDNNTFVEAVQDYIGKRLEAGKSAGDMETTDTSIDMGIKLSF